MYAHLGRVNIAHLLPCSPTEVTAAVSEARLRGVVCFAPCAVRIQLSALSSRLSAPAQETTSASANDPALRLIADYW
jgi:hypothetical protein